MESTRLFMVRNANARKLFFVNALWVKKKNEIDTFIHTNVACIHFILTSDQDDFSRSQNGQNPCTELTPTLETSRNVGSDFQGIEGELRNKCYLHSDMNSTTETFNVALTKVNLNCAIS